MKSSWDSLVQQLDVNKGEIIYKKPDKHAKTNKQRVVEKQLNRKDLSR